MKLYREEVFTGINLPNLSIDPFISLKVAVQLFEPEIRLCAKEPSSKYMSQSVEYENYFRYQIVCLCQPGLQACSHISNFKDGTVTLSVLFCNEQKLNFVCLWVKPL